MKRTIVVLMVIAAAALIVTMFDISIPPHKHSDQELAKGCLATVEQLNAARLKANAASNVSPAAFGRCTLSKRADGRLDLNVAPTKSDDRQ